MPIFGVAKAQHNLDINLDPTRKVGKVYIHPRAIRHFSLELAGQLGDARCANVTDAAWLKLITGVFVTTR